MAIPEIVPDQRKTPLVRSGIYRFVRHPRYLEFILEILGIAILSGLWANFILLGCFLVAIYIAAKFEEKELVERFGLEYSEYQKRTGMFFPQL